MLGAGGARGSRAISRVDEDSEAGSDQNGLERQALNRAHRFPELAARAVPDEALRTVAAIRATVARARHCNLPQSLRDPVDRVAALLGRERFELGAVDETREHFVPEHEALDAARKRVRPRTQPRKIADD